MVVNIHESASHQFIELTSTNKGRDRSASSTMVCDHLPSFNCLSVFWSRNLLKLPLGYNAHLVDLLGVDFAPLKSQI